MTIDINDYLMKKQQCECMKMKYDTNRNILETMKKQITEHPLLVATIDLYSLYIDKLEQDYRTKREQIELMRVYILENKTTYVQQLKKLLSEIESFEHVKVQVTCIEHIPNDELGIAKYDDLRSYLRSLGINAKGSKETLVEQIKRIRKN